MYCFEIVEKADVDKFARQLSDRVNKEIKPCYSPAFDDEDGNAVARHIRSSSKPDTPILGISGSSEEVINNELFNFTLAKPFKLKALRDMIRSST